MDKKTTIDNKVEDVEVSEQEFKLYLNNLLGETRKAYNNIIEIANSVNAYKALDFKIKYYFNEVEGSYYFKFFEKEKTGFKK